MKLALNIEELYQYKDFVLKCPSIGTYIHMKGKSKSSVEFGLLIPIEEYSKKSVQAQLKEPNPTQKGKEKRGLYIKDMEYDQLSNILQVILPRLDNYSKTNEKNYAELCKELLEQGLTDTTSPQDLQSIFNIELIRIFICYYDFPRHCKIRLKLLKQKENLW